METGYDAHKIFNKVHYFHQTYMIQIQHLDNDYQVILDLFGVFIHEMWNKSREPTGFELMYVQSHE